MVEVSAALPGFSQKAGTCSPRGQVPALTQRHSKSLSSACKPPPLISHGTAPAARGLGWHRHPCWHPQRLSLGSTAELTALQELQTTLGAPQESLPWVPMKQEWSHGEWERQSTWYPQAAPFPRGWSTCKINGILVRPLSMVQVLICSRHSEGSCISSTASRPPVQLTEAVLD